VNWDAVVRLLAMRFHFTAWTRLEPNTALHVTYINSTANRLPHPAACLSWICESSKNVEWKQIRGGLAFL
jgi:hypothetical protein